jgi:dephospho-CoA kinase
MSKKIIFGLSGHPSGGKDTVAKYLVAHYGFKHISTGDGLRAYIRQHNLGELDRENMNKVVTELRKKFGNDFLVRDVLDNNSSDRLVLSGLRSSGEAKAIKTAGGILVAVDATMQTRYRRALARGRIGDEISFATFAAEQNKEDSPTNPNAPSVAAVTSIADEHIDNSTTRAHTYAQVNNLMKRLNIKPVK